MSLLKKIRSLSFGYTIVLVGLILCLSGVKMTTPDLVKKTFLCFHESCIYIQGVSNFVLGIITIVMGLLMIRRMRNKKEVIY